MRYNDKRQSFDSAQDDVTLNGVEVLTILNFLCIKLTACQTVPDSDG